MSTIAHVCNPISLVSSILYDFYSDVDTHACSCSAPLFIDPVYIAFKGVEKVFFLQL